MKSELNAVISIPDSPDYFFKKHRYRAMQQWIDEQEIEFFVLKTKIDDDIPHTIVMDSVSAVAFRLKFDV